MFIYKNLSSNLPNICLHFLISRIKMSKSLSAIYTVYLLKQQLFFLWFEILDDILKNSYFFSVVVISLALPMILKSLINHNRNCILFQNEKEIIIELSSFFATGNRTRTKYFILTPLCIMYFEMGVKTYFVIMIYYL